MSRSAAAVGAVAGEVVRLQVQRGPLKPGPVATRVYDPAPLLACVELHVAPAGCLGREAATRQWVVDAHHAAHPASRHHPKAPLSVMTTAAYALLRSEFGPHLADGVAGEGVLVDAGELLPADLVDGGWTIGDLELTGVGAAAPCVEFSRWSLGLPGGAPVDAAVREALARLGGGARGVYAVPAAAAVVRLGDPLVRR